MGDVIDLFSGRAIPEPEESESDFVERFRESALGEFMHAARGIDEAETIEDLKSFMSDVRDLVRTWPDE